MAAVKDIDLGYKRIMAELKNAAELTLTVGIHADAKPYDPGSEGGERANVAQIYSIHEYGTANIPPRPTMTPTLDTKGAAYQAFLEISYAKVLEGKMGAEQALKQLGVRIEGDIRNAIVALTSPALAPSTIAARERRPGLAKALAKLRKKEPAASLDKPLIDTGHMKASLAHKIERNWRPGA